MFGQTAKQKLVTSGNGTLDKFLGGGFPLNTVNLFERHGPSSKVLDPIINKSVASATLTNQDSLIFVNFNTAIKFEEEDFLLSLPATRQVKLDALNKDIRGSSNTKIEIAWRYSQRGISSPSDVVRKTSQVDFGLSWNKMNPDKKASVQLLNVSPDDYVEDIFSGIDKSLALLRASNPSNNIVVILKDLLHPLSPMVDNNANLLRFLYHLKCLTRSTDNCVVILTYDIAMCNNHNEIKNHIYNLADSVVSFYSYETDENNLTGYKDINGTSTYFKVPKINSYGFHFQRDLSDWGYRLTKNNRYFVLDELSLPPCHDDDDSIKQKAGPGCRPRAPPEMLKIENTPPKLGRSNPLDEFRGVAKDILSKKI